MSQPLDPAPFRCSAASADEGEQLVGTAPTDTAWLFVEYAGSWGRKALTESRLPEGLGGRLDALKGIRVQLIRRHGPARSPRVRVFTALAGPTGARVETALLDRVEEVEDLDLPRLAAGDGAGLTPYDDPLWLVCTNGRRDVCCAERGRPVAERLASQWPEQTWETTHLGGHRFAATVLPLPSGVMLGRLDPGSANRAGHELAGGRWPGETARGRVGVPPAAQVAEQQLREHLGLAGIADVEVSGAEPGPGDETTVYLRTAGASWRAAVNARPGPERRQSCADEATKPTSHLSVVSLEPADV